MNLQSPTTLLTSIQFMRSKLRNDRQILMDIKDDFTQVARKPRTKQNQNLINIPNNESRTITTDARQSTSIDRPAKNKILELKKEHQKEIVALKEAHQRQIEQLMKSKNDEILSIESQWKKKVEQQANYISILEDQIQSPIQSERIKPQIEATITNLLKNNTKLQQQLDKARHEVNIWRKQCMEAEQNDGKSRFKFGKKKNINNKSGYQSQKCRPFQHKQTNSMYAFNDQNIDSSNISVAERWEDLQIKDEEGGLRTIRQFHQASVTGEDAKKRRQYSSVNL